MLPRSAPSEVVDVTQAMYEPSIGQDPFVDASSDLFGGDVFQSIRRRAEA
jgi:hypothetical protein